MDNRPIGFFDSGLGGLTSIPYLMRELPEEKIVYFGDTARTPYGSKSPETIRKFSRQIVEFLLQQDVKMIVIACNTVSSTCLEDLRARFPQLPILGIIGPAAEKAVRVCSEYSHLGIIATKATVKSGMYEKLIRELSPKMDIHSIACPAFVPLIEEGIINNDIMDLTIRYYMEDFILENRIDTIILGCTHYPLIRANIERAFHTLKIINPSEEIIGRIRKVLTEKDMLAKDSPVENTFYASDLSESFTNMIDTIFNDEPVKVKFKNLERD